MHRPKLALIKPTQILSGQPLKLEKGLTPTRVLPYLAAMTPDAFDVSITDDATQEIDYDATVDLVGITSLISQIPRAIEIADRFREKGVKVVMGGVGASSVPDEVLPHVDSLVVGEAEDIWPVVLDDFVKGCLQRTYRSAEFCTMQRLPIPRFDLLKRGGYVRPGAAFSKTELPRIPIETSRGCPHDCEFCSVTRYFGRRMRFRPIEQVVAEMKRFPGAYFFLVDDNIAADRERAKALFRAMIPLQSRWIAQFSSLAASDGELLDLARKAGCINAFVGVESFQADALRSVGKKHNVGKDFGTMIAAFHSAGIDLNVSMIVGFDADTPDSIRDTIEIACRHKVHLMSLFILTPIPGTQLHARLTEQGRILHRDYSLYDGTHAVFQPRNMSAADLENLYWESFGQFYKIGNMFRRFSDALSWMTTHPMIPLLYAYMGNRFYRRAIAQRIHPLCGGIPRQRAPDASRSSSASSQKTNAS